MYQEVNLTGKKLASKKLTGFISLAGGTKDYDQLDNKPSINNVELSGNKTLSDLGIATKTSELVNDSDFISGSELAAVAISGSYNDLINLPTIPTKTSDLVNNSGFTKLIVSNDIAANGGILDCSVFPDGSIIFLYRNADETQGIYIKSSSRWSKVIPISPLSYVSTNGYVITNNNTNYMLRSSVITI